MSIERPHILYDLSGLGPAVLRPNLYAGIPRVIDHVARELAARDDVQVQFYAGENWPESLEYTQKHASMHGRMLPLPYWPRVLGKPIYRASRVIATTAHNRALPFRAARWTGAQAMARIRKSHSRLPEGTLQKFDVFHSPLDPVPAEVNGALGTRKFLTVYDLIPRLFPHQLSTDHRMRYERIFDSIDQQTFCLCISEHTRRDVCAHCDADPAKCFVTPLAASENFAPSDDRDAINAARAKYNIPRGRYLLALATLEPRKNFPLVIRAFTEAAAQLKGEDVYLVVVGNKGWNYDEIFATAAASEATRRRVLFTGYVAEEDLRFIYSGCTAFVYMSQYEGFGLPPLEAMQCGVPVITSNTSSLPEVVGDGGIMLDPHDEPALTEAMLRIVSEPSVHEELRQKALKRASGFSWRLCADRTVDAYRAALSMPL